jgi:hypothetical protein
MNQNTFVFFSAKDALERKIIFGVKEFSEGHKLFIKVVQRFSLFLSGAEGCYAVSQKTSLIEVAVIMRSHHANRILLSECAIIF